MSRRQRTLDKPKHMDAKILKKRADGGFVVYSLIALVTITSIHELFVTGRRALFLFFVKFILTIYS